MLTPNQKIEAWQAYWRGQPLLFRDFDFEEWALTARDFIAAEFSTPEEVSEWIDKRILLLVLAGRSDAGIGSSSGATPRPKRAIGPCG